MSSASNSAMSDVEGRAWHRDVAMLEKLVVDLEGTDLATSNMAYHQLLQRRVALERAGAPLRQRAASACSRFGPIPLAAPCLDVGEAYLLVAEPHVGSQRGHALRLRLGSRAPKQRRLEPELA